MNNTTNNTTPNQPPQAPASATGAKESEEESASPGSHSSAKNSSEKADATAGEEDVVMMEKDSAAAGVNSMDDPMEEDAVNPATVFCIKLKQPKSNLLHKMSVPELCALLGTSKSCKEASCWQLEHEWRQDIAVVTKWLSGVSPYRWLSARSSGSTKSTFEEKFLSQQPNAPAPLVPVPPNQTGAPSKWFCTSKGLLGAGPSGIMAADAIVTDSGAMHVAGVPIVNPSTVVVWEVTPGPGNGFQVSNFSAYVKPEAAAQSAATTTWGSGVTAVAFDPNTWWFVWGKVLLQALVCLLKPIGVYAGQYMSPYDPDEGPSVTGWRVQRWESTVENVVIHQIFGNPSSNFGGQAPKQTVWVSKVIKCIPASSEFKCPGASQIPAVCDGKSTLESGAENSKKKAVDSYQINVGSAIAAPAFSSTSCCSASVWHDTGKDYFGGVFWWELTGVDAVGCTQSAAEDGIVSLNSVIAVLDADFHSLPSTQHRQQYGPSLDRIKCRLLEGTTAQEVRAMVLDMQARLLLDMLGKGIESALINPSALVLEPWQASGETLSGIDPEAMAVEPALILSIQAYVDAVLDLASHFITRLRRYASFCRTLASHAATAGTGGSRNLVTSPSQSASAPATTQAVNFVLAPSSGTQGGTASSTGTPAVRLIGDCHFLHRLCQLLLFCFFFRRTQLPRFIGAAQRNADSSGQKPQVSVPGKSEETNSVMAKPASAMIRSEETQITRTGQVKVLFLILMDLCRRTSGLAHPLPVSQVGSSNIQVRLHYIDGNYTVLPEVVEASLGPHMQNMPRPRGADAAGLLLRELELHPPAEEWHKRNMFGGPWSDTDDTSLSDDSTKYSSSMDLLDSGSSENGDVYNGTHTLWPRKRRMSERDAAFGLNTSVGLGAYYGIMGSRRDVVTAVWKTGLEGVWYK
ncbi:Mediator of RNA polymerase II transcription subunit, partial [Sesamum angolense]